MKEIENDFTVWRYMSFAQLIDILVNKKLYFHFLAYQSDDQEGKLLGQLDLILNKFIGNGRLKYAVNSWQKSEYQSLLMWKAYCANNNGVAIKSSYLKLLKVTQDNPDFFVKEAEYNFNEETNNIIHTAYSLKRAEYKTENEIRIVGYKNIKVIKHPSGYTESWPLIGSENTRGFKISVDPSKLIDALYVQKGESWVKIIIEDLIQDKYDFEVFESTIS